MAQGELHVICAGGFRAAMERIAPRFESATGHNVVLTFGTPAKTRELVSAGRGFDAIVVTAASLNEEAASQLIPDSRFRVAMSPVGMGVKMSLPAAPIGTVDELKAVIERLPSVGLSDPKAGTNLANDILAAADRLGFGADLRSRAKYVMGPGSVVSAEVAKGHVDAVITLTSEIVSDPGVRYLGPVPDALGLGTPFDGAVGLHAASEQAARSFLAFLTTDAEKTLMREAGLKVAS